MTQPPMWVTVAEVATALRVSKMTVYRMIHSEELEGCRVRNSIRVRNSEVARYLRETRIGGV